MPKANFLLKLLIAILASLFVPGKTVASIGAHFSTKKWFAYDEENRLVSVEMRSGAEWRSVVYGYDYRTRRVKRDAWLSALVPGTDSGVFSQKVEDKTVVFSGGTSAKEYGASTPLGGIPDFGHIVKTSGKNKMILGGLKDERH